MRLDRIHRTANTVLLAVVLYEIIVVEVEPVGMFQSYVMVLIWIMFLVMAFITAYAVHRLQEDEGVLYGRGSQEAEADA